MCRWMCAQGTQVEPAVPYSEAGFTYSNYQPQDSDYYLRLTRQFVDEFEHQQQRQQ